MAKDEKVKQGPLDAATAAQLVSTGQALIEVATPEMRTMALQFPRDLMAVTERAIVEAKMAGAEFYYRWPVKNKDGTRGWVEGCSIEMALCLMRNFGNVRVGQTSYTETRDAYHWTVGILDLETGSVWERPYRMSKGMPVQGGKLDKFREEDIRFQIGYSKAARNAILNFIPSTIKNKVFAAAMDSVRGVIEAAIEKRGGEIDAVIKPMLAKFEPHGVTQERLEVHYGARDAWLVDELVLMTGDLKQLEQKRESAATLYPVSAEEEAESAADEQPEGAPKMGPTSTGSPDAHQDHEPPNATPDGKQKPKVKTAKSKTAKKTAKSK